jgi:hypothetical protein
LKPAHRTLLLAGCCLTLALVLLARDAPDLRPEGDLALTDIQVISGVRGWQPLGAYSRANGNHPGPFYFQLLTPLYVLSGYRHAAILITVALLNLGSLVGCVLVMRRHANGWLLLATTGCMAVFLSRFSGLLASPWNPHVAMLPLLFCLLAGAAVAAGRHYRLIPVMVAAGSLSIQAHFAYAVPVLTVAAGTMVLALVGRRWQPALAEHHPHSARRYLFMGAAVGACIWALPVIDEIRPAGDHNMTRVITYLMNESPGDSRQASRAFEHLFVSPLTPGLQLWGTPLPRGASLVRGLFHAQCLLLAAATIFALNRRRFFEAFLALLVVFAGAAGWLAIQRTPGRIEVHTVQWIAVLGALSWSVIVAGALRAFPSRAVSLPGGAARRVWAAACVGAVAVAAAISVVTQIRDSLAASAPTRGVSDIVEEYARARNERPYLDVTQQNWGIAAGVVLQLYRQGTTPMIPPSRVSMFGKPFAPGGPSDRRLTFVTYEEHADDYGFRENFVHIGRFSNIHVYEAGPAPVSQTITESIAIVDRSGEVDHAERVVDRQRDGSEAARTYFRTSAAYVTLAAPAGHLIGLRMWGEVDSSWQVRCSRDGNPFERIGQVKIPGGQEQGETYLRLLSECREIKIAKALPPGESWLTEIEVLRLPAPATGR